MKTASRIIWAAAGVGGIGVLVGLGLMMAGDLMGRRDEAALTAVMSAPAASNPSAMPLARGAAATPRAGAAADLEVSQTLAYLETRAANSPLDVSVVQEAADAITIMSDGERVVDRQQLIDATQGNPFQLVFSQTKFVPHLEGARSGLRVAAVADSPWTQKAGLEPGDVLMAVNGKPVLDPRQMGEIAKELITASEVAITIQRAGQKVDLQYHMGPVPQAPMSSRSP